MKQYISTHTSAGAIGLFLFLFISTGCASMAERHHPDYANYKGTFRTLLILPPQFQIMDEMADQKILYNGDLSRTAGELSLEAVVDHLTGKDYRTRVLPPETAAADEIQQITALFATVNRSIQLHTYGSQPFPFQKQSFEYAVGNIENLLRKNNADAMVLVTGKETLSSFYPRVWISVALIEPKGEIVWYCVQGANEILQLGDIKDMAMLVKKTLQNFPSGTQ
ncbi:MAG: hypothetical protein HKM93_23370 [Desulfobacteraceae bacterium]|nr:hypothetical protein [Desulfobacteraceae bacterium]